MSENFSDHYLMVLNTQSYMWDGIGMVGYLLGPTLRAPYGANKSGTQLKKNDHHDRFK